MTTINNFYHYEVVHRLLYNNRNISCDKKDVAPLNKQEIKVHRGVRNKILFKVFAPDNSIVSFCDNRVYARVTDRRTSEQILEYRCFPKNNGIVELILDEGTLVDVAEGHYHLSLLVEQYDGSLVPLYTDYDGNIDTVLHVTSQAQQAPIPSEELVDWYPCLVHTPSYGNVTTYRSSAFKAARVKNHIHSMHSFSIHCNNYYSGYLKVYGTLDSNPNADITRGWFTIDVLDLNEDHIAFVNFLGTRIFSFKGNYSWLRFEYQPDPSIENNKVSISKILVRS